MNQQFYTTPVLTIYGDVEVLTKSASTGSRLDQDFPAGTPAGDITFSGAKETQEPTYNS